MYYFKIILCIFTLVFTLVLCSCSSPTRIETRTVCEAQLPLNLSIPTLELESVYIDVKTEDNKTFYIFDSENFRKMTENDVNILNHVQALDKIISEYKKYYKEN